MPIYGIDLGTSNCLVAEAIETLSGDFEIRCLRDEKGNESFPSVVSFKSKNEVVVGEKALFELYKNPDQTVELIKTRLGKKKYLDIEIDGEKEQIETQKISGIVLNHFNKIHKNKIKKAVLTVPAIFDEQQKKATAQSGQVADIELVRTIPEPCAAVMYHVFRQYKDNKTNLLDYKTGKNVLVFDFGGGTLDLALASIKLDDDDNVEITVLAIGGDEELGGNLIDFKLTEVVLDYYCDEFEYDKFIEEVKEEYDYYYSNYRANGELRFRDNAREEVKSFIFRLKNKCERAKIELSTKNITTLTPEGIYSQLDIDREDFKELVLEDGDLLPRIKESIRIIQGKNKKNVPIDQVILVGGSAQIPYIKKYLQQEFPHFRNKIINAIDYDNAIAKGAAILAAIEDGHNVPPFGRNNVKNVVAHDLYVNQDGINENDEPFLSYGTSYPFSERQTKDLPIRKSLDTKINIKFVEKFIRQGTEKEKIIQDINFYHPFFYTNDHIRVEIDIDELGMYKFTATHVETGESIEFEAEQLFEMSNTEIEKAKREIKILRDIS